MDLYIFCVVLGAAGMAAMAFLGFASSHGGAHHGGAHQGHDTSGHEMHGIGASHGHSIAPSHGVAHGPVHGVAHGPEHGSVQLGGGVPHNVAHLPAAQGRGHPTADGHGDHLHPDGWKSNVWSWLSPRVLFNFLVGFGATGMVVERLVGPVLALPIAVLGGIGFEAFVVRPLFNSLFRFESKPAQTLESALMSEGRAVTGFDANGNGLISLELGGEVVQVLGTQLKDERTAGVRIRAGDIVRIEEVDDTRNRCTVSRIGLGETETGDADRN
jgi:hypothetical protein